MNRSALILGISAAVAVFVAVEERRASACGGCFHPPTQTVTDITDEKMLLSVSTTQTTLYDQILYSGSPSSFAWVLPIHGTVDVGLSADVLFDSVDVLTATQIIPPPQNCPPPPNCYGGSSSGAASIPISAGSADAGVAGVVVTKQQNVGPYETVQLQATDSTALATWLAQNGFDIPADVQPVIDAYISEGFDFLAMKLLPDQGVQAMRPVRVTTPGASLSLPLRMASVGTGAIVGISIWVVADGRYEPQNFPFYHIDDADLVWDWSTNASNYTTLRTQFEADSNNTAWEIESSLTLNEQLVDNVVLSGGQYYGGGGFGVVTPTDASEDYLPVGSPDGGTDGGAYETAEQVRDADLAALFAGMTGPSVRFTRIRSDIAHAAMTTDFVVQASSDQSELSNVRNVTQSVNLVCPVYPACPSSSSGVASSGSASSGSGSGANASSGSGSSGTGSNGSGPSDGSKDQSGGCAASEPGRAGGAVELAAIMGLLGVIIARAQSRRRSRGA
jgi:hypothetical protein